LFGGGISSVIQKVQEETDCRIPDSSSLCVIFDEEGYHKYWHSFVSKLSDNDMDMQRQACAVLLPVFTTFASCHNPVFTYECVIYFSARSQDV
jgi:hypothetical protein